MTLTNRGRTWAATAALALGVTGIFALIPITATGPTVDRTSLESTVARYADALEAGDWVGASLVASQACRSAAYQAVTELAATGVLEGMRMRVLSADEATGVTVIAADYPRVGSFGTTETTTWAHDGSRWYVPNAECDGPLVPGASSTGWSITR